MKKSMIGNLEVSEIAMGCLGFSHGYGQMPEETYSIEAIRKAYETVCTLFDTAKVYGDVLFPRTQRITGRQGHRSIPKECGIEH